MHRFPRSLQMKRQVSMLPWNFGGEKWLLDRDFQLWGHPLQPLLACTVTEEGAQSSVRSYKWHHPPSFSSPLLVTTSHHTNQSIWPKYKFLKNLPLTSSINHTLTQSCLFTVCISPDRLCVRACCCEEMLGDGVTTWSSLLSEELKGVENIDWDRKNKKNW